MGEDVGASRNFIEDNALTKSFLEPLPAGACRFAEKLPGFAQKLSKFAERL
jgi:hypothetical protein